MSTRSYILMEQEDGSYLGSYCHSDGYLTYNGAILIDHYNEREKVERLLSFGNMSTLCERIDPNPMYSHSFAFDKRQDGVCVFYGRDRGEVDQEARTISLEKLSNDPWIEYTYIFTLDNKWKYFESGGYKGKESLKDVKEDLDSFFSKNGIYRPKNLYGYYDEGSILIIKSQQQKEKRKEEQMKKTNENEKQIEM